MAASADKVLVVEDDEATREMYRHALSAAGYAVAAVEDGLDALRRLEVEHPDAVVLDLLLPRLAGSDVYQEIRANAATRYIPIVIVTGSELPNLQPNHFRYVLRKPVLPEAVVAAVTTALAHRRRGPAPAALDT